MQFLIAGLGNPGREHARQRHNIGFMAADALHAQAKGDAWKNKFDGEIAAAKQDGHDLLLFKPMTYMNASGPAIAQAARFYKIPLEQIIVLHDELDVPFGETRIKQGGGNGGHNGLRSLDAHMDAGYWRVRLGIGHPGEKYLVTPHVLGNFFAEEETAVATWLTALAKDFSLLLDGLDKNGASDLQRRLNPKSPPKPKPPKPATAHDTTENDSITKELPHGL